MEQLLQQQITSITDITASMDQLNQQSIQGLLLPQTLDVLIELANSMLKNAQESPANTIEEAAEYALAS